MIVVSILYNQFNELHPCVMTQFINAATNPFFIFIDNSDKEEASKWENFLHENLTNYKYIKNKTNQGVISSLNQGYELAKESDIIAFLHNDVYIYSYGWDIDVIETLSDPEVGLTGFFGHEGLDETGMRVNCVTNMVNYHNHAHRITSSPYILSVDGYSVIVKTEVLNKQGGFDKDYKHHHIYDLNVGLDIYNLGYKAKLTPVICEHIAGGSSGDQYKSWANETKGSKEGDNEIHTHNAQLFFKKWKDSLPNSVDSHGNLSKPINKK